MIFSIYIFIMHECVPVYFYIIFR